MAWWLLIAASAAEIVMALALKYAQGWTRLWPGVLWRRRWAVCSC